MPTVVTGAAGHLGANLVRALLERGRSVRALIHRDRRGVEGLDVELVQADVTDQASLVEAFRGAEVVYHLAAQVEVAGATLASSRRVNVLGTRNVVSACLARGVGRLVHVSSCQALSQHPLRWPVDDCRPLVDTRRCSVYDQTKALAERVVQRGLDCGLDAVIARPSAILGPYDAKPSQMGAFLGLVARGWLPILVTGGHDWVDARDVAEGLIAAEEQGRRGEGYLLSGRYLTLLELGRLTARAAGRPEPRWAAPRWLARAGAPLAEELASRLGKRPLWSPEAVRILGGNGWLSPTKAERELGYRRRSIEQTLEDTIAWFRRSGLG